MYFSKRTTYSFVFSIISSVCGVCILCLWPIIVDCGLSLHCNPVMYRLWKDIPIGIKTEFYFFNWTNPLDIHNSSIKPKFKELGPYNFIQKEQKTNVVWNDNGTVTFQQRRFWYYDKEGQNKNLQDKITSVDPTVLGISYVTRDWNYYIRRGAFLTLSGYFSSAHSTHTVAELLYDGYSEPLIKIAAAMPFFSYLQLPSWDKFGWIYDRNGSSVFDGVFNMGTGRNSILGEMYHWNYKSRTGFFNGECGRVQGSSSQFFPRNLNRDPIKVFSTDLSRTVSLKFAEEHIVYGILGYKYIAEDFMLDNGTSEPSNKCFCPGECLPTGLANISAARHHAPLFASLPHFYGADPYYVNLIEGLNPDKEKHEFSVTIEPTTGMILEANAKLQVNLLMQHIPGTKLFENVPKVLIPVLWSQQKVQLPKREAFMLKIILIFPTLSKIIGVLCILIGAALIFYEGFAYRRHIKALSQKKMRENIFQLEKLMK